MVVSAIILGVAIWTVHILALVAEVREERLPGDGKPNIEMVALLDRLPLPEAEWSVGDYRNGVRCCRLGLAEELSSWGGDGVFVRRS